MIHAYARVSTMEQAEGSSLGEQLQRIVGWATMTGRETPRTYSDEGVSGSVPLKERTCGGIMWREAQPGDVIVAAKLDRLFRSAEDALTSARELAERGVQLVMLDISPEPVTQDGVGKIVFTMLAAFAEFERARIRDRVAEGRRAKRAKGGHIGGVTPFGYRKVGSGKEATLVEDPRRPGAIQTILEAREAGMSLRATAQFVQDRHGMRVSYEAIRKLLAKLP